MNAKKDETSEKSCFLGILTSLLVGLSAGFVVGILFASKSGEETRKEIKEKGDQAIEKSKEGFDTFIGKTKDM